MKKDLIIGNFIETPYICKMKTKGEYRGVPWESEDELWFLFWAFELHNKGIIETIERAPSFSLTEGLDHEFVIKNSKGKEVTKRQIILRPSHYTPEFLIQWEQPQYKRFVWVRSATKCDLPLVAHMDGFLIQTYIEVKPDFDRNNMTRLFKNNQKFMWDKHKIFVNLVKVKELFEKTFTPSKFLKTKTGKDRKLSYKPITIEQYLDERTKR